MHSTKHLHAFLFAAHMHPHLEPDLPTKQLQKNEIIHLKLPIRVLTLCSSYSSKAVGEKKTPAKSAVLSPKNMAEQPHILVTW